MGRYKEVDPGSPEEAFNKKADKKARVGWSDGLKLAEAVDESVPPHEDPLLQQIVSARYTAKLEVRAKELEMALYLAKARISELELEKLKLKLGE